MLLYGERESARFATRYRVRSRCSFEIGSITIRCNPESRWFKLEMNVQTRFTTLRFCSRCQTYKPRKGFVYVAGNHVCADCGGSATRQLQGLARTKPRRNRSE